MNNSKEDDQEEVIKEKGRKEIRWIEAEYLQQQYEQEQQQQREQQQQQQQRKMMKKQQVHNNNEHYDNDDDPEVQQQQQHLADDNNGYDDDDNNNNSLNDYDSTAAEEALTDLFADPDPYDTFEFSFRRPFATVAVVSNHHEDKDDNNTTINISLTGYKAENGQILHSTGLTLWRASHLLCDYLLQNTHCVQGKRVLELGAGLGLCGILAFHLHAHQVIVTDGDSDTLSNLRSNIKKNCCYNERNNQHPNNGSSTMQHQYSTTTTTSSSSSIESHQLIWGVTPLNSIISTTTNTSGTKKEKQEEEEEEEEDNSLFDTILGSDIIYVEEILVPLWTTVSQCLKKHGGKFVLSYARRNVPMEKVFTVAEQFGFQWTTIPNTSEGVFIFEKVTKQT